jgi:Asp/Glu/hydantoin racemase
VIQTKRKTLALIHTSATLEPVFAKLCADMDLAVDLLHIADDSLIRDVIAEGQLTDLTSERVQAHIAAAEQANADYIMVTCSSIGPAVDSAKRNGSVPILRVDQPMADQAVRIGNRVGVIATLPTTLVPTADLIRRRAAEVEKTVEITAELCTGAFEALMTGNVAEHDAAVIRALRSLSDKVDVIVLAQASMARVIEQVPKEEIKVPILASPPIAVDFLKHVL